MLLVNEKTDQVVNMNLVEEVTIDNITRTKIVIFGIIEDDVWDIAQYKSPEEAHKVLMDIVSAYANGEKVFFMP